MGRLRDDIQGYRLQLVDVPKEAARILARSRRAVANIQPDRLPPLPATKAHAAYASLRALHEAENEAVQRQRVVARVESIGELKQLREQAEAAEAAIRRRISRTLNADLTDVDPALWSLIEARLNRQPDRRFIELSAVLDEAVTARDLNTLKVLRRYLKPFAAAVGESLPLDDLHRRIDETLGGDRGEAWQVIDELDGRSGRWGRAKRVAMALDQAGLELKPDGSGPAAPVLPDADGGVIEVDAPVVMERVIPNRV